MRTFPRGERELECPMRRRGFTGLDAFDRHKGGPASRRCLEPSSIGLWLATDGLWSTTPRNARLVAETRAAAGRTSCPPKDRPRDTPSTGESRAFSPPPVSGLPPALNGPHRAAGAV